MRPVLLCIYKREKKANECSDVITDIERRISDDKQQ